MSKSNNIREILNYTYTRDNKNYTSQLTEEDKIEIIELKVIKQASEPKFNPYKREESNLENYRPISLFFHTYKWFTEIWRKMLDPKLHWYQPKEQAGSTTDFRQMTTYKHLKY